MLTKINKQKTTNKIGLRSEENNKASQQITQSILKNIDPRSKNNKSPKQITPTIWKLGKKNK